MQMITVRHLFVSVALLAACSEPAGPTPALPGDDGRIAFVIGEPKRRDAVEIVSARMEADTMIMDVRYGGGCRDHAFVLVGGSVFLESMPVQTSVELVHDGNGDACDALLTQRLRADMTPLREAYVRGGGGTHGTIAINIGAIQLQYTF